MDNQPKKISIVIPVFNEKNTIAQLVSQVESVAMPHEKEITLVDDGSTDGTREVLKQYEGRHKVILMNQNAGKGVALKRGFQEATGDIVIIQDADLEYDPTDYHVLIEPIMQGRADVVYGSRFATSRPHRVFYNHHYLANRCLTLFSNLLTGLNLSDMETCYKVFTKDALQKIAPRIQAKRFGIEPELTALVAKNNFRVYEVGIAHHGRTYAEGKKINWKDGLVAIWHIINFNLFKH